MTYINYVFIRSEQPQTPMKLLLPKQDLLPTKVPQYHWLIEEKGRRLVDLLL